MAIELPSKLWRPKLLNKYLPINYSDDIDKGVFDYSCYGKAFFRPNLQWADRPRLDLIIFNVDNDTAELEKELKIEKQCPILP